MFRHTALFFGSLMFWALLGCEGKTIIVVHEPPADLPADAEVVYVDDDAAIAEIDAVRTLNFESERAEHLLRIARRSNLDHRAQSHLVLTALDVLDFESSRNSVLFTLAKNPTLCPHTKQVMFNQVKRLDFDSSRSKLLRLLAENPGVPCGLCVHDAEPEAAAAEPGPSLN